MFEKLYHVSNQPGLKVLEPRVSTHGKAYVYATPYLEFALLFGSKKSNGDLDGSYGLNKEGKPFFYEAYEGALKRRFEKEKCYIYEVDIRNFKTQQTSFKGEVVSEEPVKVLKCTEVDDLYEYLQTLIKNGELDFKPYSLDENYQDFITEHIKSRLIMFNILEKKDKPIYQFCKQKFPNLVDELESSKCIKRS